MNLHKQSGSELISLESQIQWQENYTTWLRDRLDVLRQLSNAATDYSVEIQQNMSALVQAVLVLEVLNRMKGKDL